MPPNKMHRSLPACPVQAVSLGVHTRHCIVTGCESGLTTFFSLDHSKLQTAASSAMLARMLGKNAGQNDTARQRLDRLMITTLQKNRSCANKIADGQALQCEGTGKHLTSVHFDGSSMVISVKSFFTEDGSLDASLSEVSQAKGSSAHSSLCGTPMNILAIAEQKIALCLCRNSWPYSVRAALPTVSTLNSRHRVCNSLIPHSSP